MPQITWFEQGQNGPVLYFCADAGEAEAVYAHLCHLTRQPFRMAAFVAEDWNRDLSPWPAPAVFGKQDFAGQGAELLAWLRGQVQEPPERAILGGYSLAGLFSLWAFYETGLFGTAVSCSGSLWYPGWEEYAACQTPKPGGAVYLSLGEREPHARNPVMARVGECTQRQHALCQAQGLRTEFVWHPGGHFQEPEMRMAKGFAWGLGNTLG